MSQGHVDKNRLFWLIVGVLGLMGLIVIRLFYLQVIKHEFYVEKQESQVKKIIKITSHRGVIYDRNGRPLALGEDAYSIYAQPPKIDDKVAFARTVGPKLGLPWREVYRMININYPFVWLARKASPEVANALSDFVHPGMNFIEEEKRVYPSQTLAADVLGFVGTDGGLGGLEFQYNDFLTGSSGRIVIEGDPLGRRIVGGKLDVRGRPSGFKVGVQRFEPTSFDGGHVHTTIDETLQYVAERELAKTIEKYEAKSGQVLVMDPHNGDILVMADYPTFNPNAYWEADIPVLKNSAVVDVYEPGSIFKLITLAAVLEEEIFTTADVLEVPETLKLANRVIKEAHRREPDDPDEYTVQEIIERSLNVGTTMMAQELGKERFYKYMKSFGFGTPTGIELPGETAGILRPPEQWSGVDIGMSSFGQGIGVTPLQMVAAVAAIANGGELVKPRVVKYLTDAEGVSVKAVPRRVVRRVISKNTAAAVSSVMQGVVDHGTGVIVRQRGYRIGGKTGTAQVAGPGGAGYLPGEYVASFVGIVTVDDPQYVILVSVHSPKKSIWGSSVAGPVFRELARIIIDQRNVFPMELAE